MSMKNSNDTIGNGNHDLPACSAVPQPTAPSRAPVCFVLYDSQYRKYCVNELKCNVPSPEP
jgi:hypothetical protein